MVHVYMCVSVYKGQGSFVVALQESFTVVFEVGSLIGLQVLMSLGWLDREPQRIYCLLFPSIGGHKCIVWCLLFMWMLGE